MKNVPPHWKTNSWEEKARENPLYAVMTSPEMADADANEFSSQHLELFFGKGRELADRLVTPWLARAPQTGSVVEYGCGAGRILNALVERDVVCCGIDVSETMLRHCRRLVPGVHSLHLLDAHGKCDLPDRCARLVFSYAVLQHIHKLSLYEKALAEMCRLLSPGGILVVQLNCEDHALARDGVLGRTENFEDYSLHYPPGSMQATTHRNSTWSGVYIGSDRLSSILAQHRVRIGSVSSFSANKLRSICVVGRRED